VIFVGIDPGLKGAIAIIDTHLNTTCFHNIPLTEEKRSGKKKNRLDRKALARLIYTLCKDCKVVVCIEDIWGFGVQHKSKNVSTEPQVQTGATSHFNFARDYGALLSVFDCLDAMKEVLSIMGFDFSVVSPQRWQKKVGKSGGKKSSIELAQELYPKAQLIPPRCRVPSDGRAEALLIAHYAALEAGAI
jgi:hypothetical protein